MAHSHPTLFEKSWNTGILPWIILFVALIYVVQLRAERDQLRTKLTIAQQETGIYKASAAYRLQVMADCQRWVMLYSDLPTGAKVISVPSRPEPRR